MIDQSARAGNLKDAARYGAQQCMECGSCSYVCPAKRPLMQSIRGTKKKLREEKKRG
jgi:electron transport complex protein RnfC